MTELSFPKRLSNLTVEQLLAHASQDKEGVFCSNGAFSVTTGQRTGRSPNDRYIVDDALTHDTVDWGQVNRPLSPKKFETLWENAEQHMANRQHFQSYLQVGADTHHGLAVEVITELAWHSVFANHLFIQPEPGILDAIEPERHWQLLNASSLTLNPKETGLHSDGVVIISMEQRKVLVCGILYAGEMKKALFTALNFHLPKHDILPMHCAANATSHSDVVLFFGLSGTGKTTLSSDPKRFLIGDDEHGWSKTGVFNFEGGCYAKCIDLTPEREPVIYDAIRRPAVIENVVLNKDKQPDYSDTTLTQNSRAAYPRTHITQRIAENRAGSPHAVVFLTCDLYGVLPPVSLLDHQQAAYYFLSGYTAKVAGTELGQQANVAPTFSTCFGAPFFPRPATVYANLLIQRLKETGAQVYLVNTGWTGGAYGQGGERFSIPTTRAIIDAVVNGSLKEAATQIIPGFNLRVPIEIPGVATDCLNPVNCWSSAAAYSAQRDQLIEQFISNFQQFDISQPIKSAGPQVLTSPESV